MTKDAVCYCCPQDYDAEGGEARMVGHYYREQRVSNDTLIQALALGHVHSLPWGVSLRVEVAGVLGEQEYEVDVRDCRASGGARIRCAPAFRPLVGKQVVAWRFMPPRTLVFAVKDPPASVRHPAPPPARCPPRPPVAGLAPPALPSGILQVTKGDFR